MLQQLCVTKIHTQCRHACTSCTPSCWVWLLVAVANQAEIPFKNRINIWKVWSTYSSTCILLCLPAIPLHSIAVWWGLKHTCSLSVLPCYSLVCLICPPLALSDLDSDACLACGAVLGVPQGFEYARISLRQCLSGRAVRCRKAVFSTFSSSLTLRDYSPSPHPISSFKLNLVIQLNFYWLEYNW